MMYVTYISNYPHYTIWILEVTLSITVEGRSSPVWQPTLRLVAEWPCSLMETLAWIPAELKIAKVPRSRRW